MIFKRPDPDPEPFFCAACRSTVEVGDSGRCSTTGGAHRPGGTKPTDEEILAALSRYPRATTEDYVEAFDLASWMRRQGFEITAIGLGRRLSRLAWREKRCEALYGLVGRYRPL